MKKAAKNQVQILALRQVCGSLQPFSRSNPVRLFTKYSQKCCFKLSDILDKEGEIRDGHVILGFTKDGVHLISYTLVIDTRLELPQPIHTYTLHWWRFQYSKPLVKVQSAHLFYNQPISEALHLIISQSPDEKQVIVWGRGPTSDEEQSCRCYVTICAAPPKTPCDRCQGNPSKPCYAHSYSAHIIYDSLPPYPVFLPSVCLQIPGTVFFNSGDSLIAFKCVPCADDYEVEDTIHGFKNSKVPEELSGCVPGGNKEIRIQDQDKSMKQDGKDIDSMNLREENKGDDDSNKDVKTNAKKNRKISEDKLAVGLIVGKNDENGNSPIHVSSWSSLASPTSSTGTITSTASHLSCESHTTYSYRKFTTPCDVPNNSFDTSDETIEVPALVMHGAHELESIMYSENMTPDPCNGPCIIVCQALLDMEQCISELIASHEDLHYSPQLQQTGFVFSWNVWNGTLQTLYHLDILDHPQGKSLSKSESTVECSRSLRQSTTVPVRFSSQVRVFSNYTVFTEKSLKYLLHPFLPILIVL